VKVGTILGHKPLGLSLLQYHAKSSPKPLFNHTAHVVGLIVKLLKTEMHCFRCTCITYVLLVCLIYKSKTWILNKIGLVMQ